MRTYYLENESGKRFCFLDISNGIAVKSPSGHGFSYDSGYTKVGDMFVRDYHNDKQGAFSLDVMFFGKDPFENYAGFCNFINAATELYLIYVPYEEKEFKRDVDIVSVDDGGFLQGIYTAKLNLNCRSLFYSTEEADYVISAETAGMTYDFTWPAWFNDYSNILCDIENDGHVDAAFQLECGGYLQNLKMQVFKNGSIIHEIVFPVTVMAGEIMKYSTLDDDLYIMIQKTDGSIQNLFPLLSMENENFFKLPKGECSIMFTCGGGSLDEVHVRVFKYYKAV